MKSTPRFALALEYDGRDAPRVTARGHDEIALAILRLAQAEMIPVHHDRELARVLEQIDLGEQIPPALYVVIAEILTFAYRLSGKHKDFMDGIETREYVAAERSASGDSAAAFADSGVGSVGDDWF